jgi:hypothetical protein
VSDQVTQKEHEKGFTGRVFRTHGMWWTDAVCKHFFVIFIRFRFSFFVFRFVWFWFPDEAIMTTTTTTMLTTEAPITWQSHRHVLSLISSGSVCICVRQGRVRNGAMKARSQQELYRELEPQCRFCTWCGSTIHYRFALAGGTWPRPVEIVAPVCFCLGDDAAPSICHRDVLMF